MRGHFQKKLIVAAFFPILILFIFYSQANAEKTISVEIGDLHFKFPAYLTDPASHAWLHPYIILPYHNKQTIVMEEIKLSDCPKESEIFDKIPKRSIKKMFRSKDYGEITTAIDPIEPILGYPSILSISYSEKKRNEKLYHLLRISTKIKMPEGIVSFRTQHDGLVQTDMARFIEKERVHLIAWVQSFMQNYEWIGDSDVNLPSAGYRTRYGLMKCSEPITPVNFDISLSYDDANIMTSLYLTSRNSWRDRMIRVIISSLVQTWLGNHNANKYEIKSLRLRQLKGRRGVEIGITTEYSAMFYWFDLTPFGRAHYTSFDIYGEFYFPVSRASGFEDVGPDPVALWNQIIIDL